MSAEALNSFNAETREAAKPYIAALERARRAGFRRYHDDLASDVFVIIRCGREWVDLIEFHGLERAHAVRRRVTAFLLSHTDPDWEYRGTPKDVVTAVLDIS